MVATGLEARDLVAYMGKGKQHAVMVFERAGAEACVSGHGMMGRQSACSNQRYV